MKRPINTLCKLTTKKAQRKFNTARLMSLWLGWMVLVVAFVQPVAGQGIIIHNATTAENEDGQRDQNNDPVGDADGEKNGIVVWKGGAIHVVSLSYGLSPNSLTKKPYTLKIESGAIVKVAGSFQIFDGRLNWSPPQGAGIFSASTIIGLPACPIQIDGATITDIRDDEVGGDTNQDGTNSVPPSSLRDLGIILQFSGSADDRLTNCTLKYVSDIRHIGSMEISNNKFLRFGRMRNVYDRNENLIGAVPLIRGNTFELISSSINGGLELRGANPVIQGNLFRYAATWEKPSSFRSYERIIEIGTNNYDKRIFPETGTAYIEDNTFETGGGIEARTIPGSGNLGVFPRFSAEIRHNTFRSPTEVNGRGYFALNLEIGAEVIVEDNDFSNYYNPLRLETFFSETSRLHINKNRFLHDQFGSAINFADTNPRFWEKGIFVDAENNFWGDPTGPLDNSNTDGLHNPRGKGLVLTNGIDYVPFIGGTVPDCQRGTPGSLLTSQSGGGPCADEIHITAKSIYPIVHADLVAERTAILNIKVDKYTLNSAPAGKIFVLVRDADQILLDPNEPGVRVVAGNATADFPEIQFKVPALSKIVTVDAFLVPDNNKEIVRSNREVFKVILPPSSVFIHEIKGVPLHGLVPGNKYTAKLEIGYTLVTSSSTSNGTLELDIKEYSENGEVVKDYPLITAAAMPGIQKTAEMQAGVELSLRDVRDAKSLLRLTVKLKDDAGKKVGENDRTYHPEDKANSVSIIHLTRAEDIGGGQVKPAAGKIFQVGERPVFSLGFSARIKTENVRNWQVWVSPTEFLDQNKQIIGKVEASSPVAENLSTRLDKEITVRLNQVIPPGTKFMKQKVRLVAPDQNITVAEEFVTASVNEVARTAQKAVPASASQVSFTPIPVALNFSSNQKAGAAFADEMAGQFGASATSAVLAKTNAFYWKFISLKRYWAVYDTLQDGTFSATVSFTYDPTIDFPAEAEFKEDSLVVAGFNPLSQELEALPTTLNKATRTITTTYTKFFQTYVVASKATVLTTAVSSKPDVEIPAHFSLAQNYPNPFNPATTIAFTLPRASHVTLKVFDVFGREVVTLVDKKFSAGRYDVHWDATGQASGVYFYRLQAEENFAQTKKLLLVK